LKRGKNTCFLRVLNSSTLVHLWRTEERTRKEARKSHFLASGSSAGDHGIRFSPSSISL